MMTVAAAGCQSLGIVEVESLLSTHWQDAQHTDCHLTLPQPTVVISVHNSWQMASAHNPKLPQCVECNRSVGSALEMARHVPHRPLSSS